MIPSSRCLASGPRVMIRFVTADHFRSTSILRIRSMQTGERGRLAQAWRRLNTNTVGTDGYWWIGLQNAAFYRDMAPLIAGHARGRTLDVGAGRLAWRSLLMQHVASYFSGDAIKEHT